MHILLIEDLPICSTLFKCLLENHPHISIDVVESIQETRKYLDNFHPDIVIADLYLPDSGPEDTLFFLRGVTRHFPVVVLTGMNISYVDPAFDCGIYGFLTKDGLTAEKILRAIKTARETFARNKEIKFLLKGTAPDAG